jgi:hypothetical protein
LHGPNLPQIGEQLFSSKYLYHPKVLGIFLARGDFPVGQPLSKSPELPIWIIDLGGLTG